MSSSPTPVEPLRVPVDEQTSRHANEGEWDRYADEYQATHGEFLGDLGFVWGPEGTREDDVRLLGDVTDLDVLEIGCGAAQCSRWVARHGGRPVGLDLSRRQLQHARRLDEETGIVVPTVQATGSALPFAARSFEVVFCSFGAMQFLADADHACQEVARVLRPGGRFVFSITHPTRWMFPDDPTEEGLVASQDYWDRTPYVEVDDRGEPQYVEHHRTLGDWVRSLSGSGFRLVDLVEPQWPAEHDRTWGGWSRVRGLLTPGTAIYVADLLTESADGPRDDPREAVGPAAP